MNATSGSLDETHDAGRLRLDGRLSAMQYWMVLLCFLVVVLDGLDTAAIGFLAPALAHDFGVPRTALAPVLSAALFGMAGGSLVAGPLADRIGRKPVLIGLVLLFGTCSIACAFAHSTALLILLRLVTGLGLGGAMPSAGTLLSEYLPITRRSLQTNVMYCGFPLGASAGGFLAAAVIPRLGWPAVFVVGGALPLILSGGLLFLPESIQFMVARQWPTQRITRVLARMPHMTIPTTASATAVALRARPQQRTQVGMIVSARFALGTVMLWVGYFMGLLVFYLLTSWLPSILADSHLNTAQSASIAALLPFGGVIGTILCGPQYLCNYLSHKDVLTVTVTNTDSKQADLAISDATEWIVQACEHSH
ncbi:MFS transporter [Paraburkholderia sediminicola]|uniref:MFS transporter n=1 Tax=Paraburkholderia sediminicola TaxID=458836 RepID=UPI0038B96415